MPVVGIMVKSNIKVNFQNILFFVASVLICVCFAIFIFIILGDDDTKLLVKHKLPLSKRSVYENGLVIGDSLSHMSVFIQISDLHFSWFKDSNRRIDLRNFLDQALPIFNPQVLLVTGDITDAKEKSYFKYPSSHQFESEWTAYSAIVKDLNLTDKLTVLDLKGNHDDFRVSSSDAKDNLYRTHSVQGQRTNIGSYLHQHTTAYGDVISFIAVDACPKPGPSRPFNFFGILTEADVTSLIEAQAPSANSSFTIWLGHYPSSIIVSPGRTFQSLIAGGAVYVCGHLHRLAPSLYTRHKSGNLELELADWRDNRKFRVLVLDHGLFSFSDERYNYWPVIIISNPKDCHFNIPLHEPLDRMLASTHIRILVYGGPSVITNVTVAVNGQTLGSAMRVSQVLYTLPWEPNKYKDKVAYITVTAQDSSGKRFSKSQAFCLNGQTLAAGNSLADYILKFDHVTMVIVLYVLSIVFHLSLLVIFRWTTFHVEGHLIKCRSSYCCNKWFRRLHAVSNCNTLFYSLAIYYMYISIGPWFAGAITDQYYGAVFVYGIVVNKTLLPGSLTFAYGLFMVWGYAFPFHLYLGYLTDKGAEHYKDRTSSHRELLITTVIMIIFVFLTSFLFVYESCVAYGFLAVLFNPVRVWSAFIFIYLCKIAFTLNYQKRVSGSSST